MSRTYRRRKGKPAGSWITHECISIEEWDHHSKYFSSRDGKWHDRVWTRHLYKEVPLTGHKLKTSLAKYHADKHNRFYSAPKWFVRDFCNKPYRAKAKAEINHMIQSGNFDDYNFNPPKHNAMWLWW